MGALEGGAGPGVEDPVAAGTARIEHGRAEIPRGGEARGGLAARAAQPSRMKEIEEELRAGLLIQEILDREIHRPTSWEAGCPVSGIRCADGRKSRGRTYQFRPMSHLFSIVKSGRTFAGSLHPRDGTSVGSRRGTRAAPAG